MTRILLGFVLAFGFSGLASADAVEDRYNKTCVVCHAAGAAGAPKTGVPAEWNDRMAKGMDVLVQSVDKGLNAMPPKGMCFDCTADEFKALIEYMAAPK
jgi:cytochrome c5